MALCRLPAPAHASRLCRRADADDCSVDAVVRKNNATADEMQAAVGMEVLDVLLILTRSQANRQRLLSLGLLPAIATSMKVRFSSVCMHTEARTAM